jgi:predicted methyltransferase
MRLIQKAHQILEQCLREGDLAIDATAGNGHDTVKLASLVGARGSVVAIDVQEAALEATRHRLEKEGLAERVRLVHSDHATFLSQLEATEEGKAGAVVFNLGYLPGSDKQVTTRPNTTLAALDAGLGMIKPGGVMLVTAYRAHPGGLAEAQAVEAWARLLEESIWTVRCDEPPSRPNGALPPVLWSFIRASR